MTKINIYELVDNDINNIIFYNTDLKCLCIKTDNLSKKQYISLIDCLKNNLGL